MSPAVLSAARVGNRIQKNLRGFPTFFLDSARERVITGDIWAYLTHISREQLNASNADKAASFVQQASDFYQAAMNPRVASRPLLYYYAFLNLSKVMLLHQRVGVPPRAYHGILDPKDNVKQRLRISGQLVRIDVPTAATRFNIFYELLTNFPVNPVAAPLTATDIKVLDLLAAVPAIHRTFCQVTGQCPLLCPIGNEIQIYQDSSGIWARIYLSKDDPDVMNTKNRFRNLPGFSALFTEVMSDRPTEGKQLYESSVEPVTTSVDGALSKLAEKFRSCGVASILTSNYGYTHYLNVSKRTNWIPQFCTAFAAMFYLGSITRYKPYDFDKIVAGYSWLISEFLDTQPTQMLHLLASHIAGTEVVSPYAVRLGQ